MRAAPELPRGHPLAGWKPPPDADCIADAIPRWLLADLEEFHAFREPPDTLKHPHLLGASLNDQGLVDFTGAPHGGAHKLLPEWQTQPRITASTIIDHTIVGEGLGAYYYFRDKTGIESHFIVHGKWGTIPDGTPWQIMSIDRQADANNEANSYAISIETGDDGTPEDTPWTPAQLETLIWLHAELARMRPSIRRAKATACQSGGLGFHTQWGAPSCWTPAYGKTCPGRSRIPQWSNILVPAFVAAPEPEGWWEVSIPPTELTKIRDQAAAPALGTTAGQQAIRAAVGAELAEAMKGLGASQAFVKQTGTPQVYLMLSGNLLHIPTQAALYAIGGASASTKVLEYPATDPVWNLPISGQLPDAEPTAEVRALADTLQEGTDHA